MASRFADMKSLSIFDVAVLPLYKLVTGPSFMLISLLVLKLRQFLNAAKCMAELQLFTVSELSRKNQKEEVNPPPPPPQIVVNKLYHYFYVNSFLSPGTSSIGLLYLMEGWSLRKSVKTGVKNLKYKREVTKKGRIP